MANLTRKNAWNSGGDFSNTDLLWYAKGVGKMMGRALNDPASWWFFAAIHGEYVNPNTPWYPSPPAFPGWGYIQSPPQVPTTPLPAPATMAQYWNQCQHGSWYFLPWHRGYLYALEAQLRADIASLGGPADWALPYWDYFGGAQGAQAVMPPAFAQKTLPDGTANPLYVDMRYGPDGNGNIYIPTEAWAETHPDDPNWSYGDVSSACMANDLYTGSDRSTPLPGFGGPETGFEHSGSPHGNMESNPHDLVHVYTGGSVSETDYGLMADPGTAALDPIFYLHHCNIDRMWASWNSAGRVNPTNPTWLKGPVRPFIMPMPKNESWKYTPAEVNSIASLNYSYQELGPVAQPGGSVAAQRLKMLGVPGAADLAAAAAASPRHRAPAELLGASQGVMQLSGRAAPTVSMRMDTGERQAVAASLKAASPSALPDQVYLRLDQVRGALDAAVIGVYIDLPADPSVEDLRKHHAGDVGLFGMRRASALHGAHNGDGLSFVLDVSHLFDRLYLDNKLASGDVRVTLRPRRELPGASKVEVGQLSLYRQPY